MDVSAQAKREREREKETERERENLPFLLLSALFSSLMDWTVPVGVRADLLYTVYCFKC